MPIPIDLKSRSQFLSDLIRDLEVETDINDVSPGSSTGTLSEGVASLAFQLQLTALKILENNSLDSLEGADLVKRAVDLRIPDGEGGFGKKPAKRSSGSITVGSDFTKVTMKMYAGKPDPYSGSFKLYLENLPTGVSIPSTGNVYIGRGTVDRFEGPIAYTGVVSSGSYMTMTLASPMTKNHLGSDPVVLAQGGNRSVGSGTVAFIPATSETPAINYRTSNTIVIPDGEDSVDIPVVCDTFGSIGNALIGAIKAFSNVPFTGATVTNKTQFVNGQDIESDENLRIRTKNYPATLSRGTNTAIIDALNGLTDPDTGETITSVVMSPPVAPGEPSKIYIDNGAVLEPSFEGIAYQLLLDNSANQETKFRTAQFPVAQCVIEGSVSGPFALVVGQELTVFVDDVEETYTITASNYKNISSASAFEVVRDLNSQSNIVGFRTAEGGKKISVIDLSGTGEEMKVLGSLRTAFGMTSATIRPLFLYINSDLKSFRGKTATLDTNPFPWSLDPLNLTNLQVKVDGVLQTFTIASSDFTQFNSNVLNATLAQWAVVFGQKIAGASFRVVNNILVWTTNKVLSSSGTLEIIEDSEWVGANKIWTSVSDGGVLKTIGAPKDYDFNRFTGEISLENKPAIGSKIEIGTPNTRAFVSSPKTATGVFSVDSLPLRTGNSKLVLGFDGTFLIRNVPLQTNSTITASIPDAVNASNVIRVTSNTAIFENVQVADYWYLLPDNTQTPTLPSSLEGFYRFKTIDTSGFWIEFEVSSPQLTNWTSSLAIVYPIVASMANIFKSENAIPQLIDFGSSTSLTVDALVSLINSQIASGTCQKLSARQLALRSNDYTSGTVGVLSVIGNASNLFSVGIASSIQYHTGYSDSSFTQGGPPVVSNIKNQTTPALGYQTRAYLSVDRDLTNITTTGLNPTIQADSSVSSYPDGFQETWLTGRQTGLSDRVYNNQPAAPYTGILTSKGSIQPLETSDTTQTNPQTLNRYANYGLRLRDLSITEVDKLVAIIDNDSINKTLPIPLYKRAKIQDMDTLSGGSKGTVISFRLKDPEDLDNSSNPTPFFDSLSPYSNYDFTDFKLLTRSVGVYRDYSTPTSAASGSLTAIKSGDSDGILDQDTFILNDGTIAVTFEFDSNGSTTGSNTPVVFTEGARATGFLIAIAQNNSTGLVNGDTFTISDGALTKTFEFRTSGPATGANIAVAIGVSASAATVQAAMITAINGSGLQVTASSAPSNTVGLTANLEGVAQNTPVSQALANFPTATLNPTGLSGGLNPATPTQMQTAIIAAINGISFNISAAPGAGSQVLLINKTPGTAGNQTIIEGVHNTLSPVGMSGGQDGTATDKALVYRSTAFGGIARLKLVVLPSTVPNQSNYVITHSNTFENNEAITTLFVNMATGATVTGSIFNTNTYTATITASGNIFNCLFVGAGLNPGGQYTVGNILNVDGNGPLAGAYKILAAGSGFVRVSMPGNGGVTSQTFDAVSNPLTSYPLSAKTYKDLADAINAYLIQNPVATGEAIGPAAATTNVTNATYEIYQTSPAYSGTDMSGAFAYNSFACKLAGSAGIWQYDSSVPSANGIKATVQETDSIYPSGTDISVPAIPYSPLDEDVMLVPTNSKTLRSWLNFKTSSSLNIVAIAEEIDGSDKVQISSKTPGSAGAVQVTGVTANSIETPVLGNSTASEFALKTNILSASAKALSRYSFVGISNAIQSEIRRAYRAVPTGASVTSYNTADILPYFRDSNYLKYERVSSGTTTVAGVARLSVPRFGMTNQGAQIEPLSASNTITFTNLSNGLVRVVSSGGDLAARVGDMMYIRPYGGSPFPSSAQCEDLDSSGYTDKTVLPVYLGYPVVQVSSPTSITVIAPNITVFTTYTLASSTDLVFLAPIWNEKNIRTTKSEGAKISTTFGSGDLYYLVKPLGNGMVSVFAQNNTTEATDNLRLNDLSVNTDDFAIFGPGFAPSNQGTFRVVAHNGRNHMVIYNPDGGKEEIFDVASGGQRDWRVGPINDASFPTSYTTLASKRPIRIVDSDSVLLGDNLRISASTQSSSTWFSNNLIGSFGIKTIGYVGRSQAVGSIVFVHANLGSGIRAGDTLLIHDGIQPFTFEFVLGSDNVTTTGNIPIRLTTNSDSASVVAAAFQTTMSLLGSAINVHVSSVSGATVNLLNRSLNTNDSQLNTAIVGTFSVASPAPTISGMSGAGKDNSQIMPFVEFNVFSPPAAILPPSSTVPVDKFVIGDTITGNQNSIGFVETNPFTGFRMVAGHGVSPTDITKSEVFLVPRLNEAKISASFGTSVKAMNKTGFPTTINQGVDGYQIFTGLIREAHRTIDGLPSNPILYPSVKAEGTFSEITTPLARSIELNLTVKPKDGVTLTSIGDIVRSAAAKYIDDLGVGQPVIIAEIIRAVQSLPGVFSVTVANTFPVVFEDRIPVSANEKAYVIDGQTDISIG